MIPKLRCIYEIMNDQRQTSNLSALILGSFALLFSLAVHADQINNTLKDNLLKGYMLTCVPTIRGQLPSKDHAKATAYCACVGGKTFQNVTKRQYEYMQSTGRLSPEIEAQRVMWRSQCNSQLD